MTDIYDQHAKHFARTSAAAILDSDGNHVANVTIRYPADGAGRLYAYVHWLGTEMVRGSASGYGYDKATAALAGAVRDRQQSGVHSHEAQQDFLDALAKDGAQRWDGALRAAGFTVLQVV